MECVFVGQKWEIILDAIFQLQFGSSPLTVQRLSVTAQHFTCVKACWSSAGDQKSFANFKEIYVYIFICIFF